MARTQRQIEESLAASIERQDASVDTVKGPVYDLFIRPESAEIRRLELQYDDLSRRYSLDYVLTRNAQILDLYGGNHGVRRSGGRAATGWVTFFTYAPPSRDGLVLIPAGTIVSTSDSSIAFRTRRDGYIYGSSLSSYYNAAARRYEVRVPVEAMGSGSLYEVPASRIVKIQTDIDGIDGVINRTRMEKSTEVESSSNFGNRIRSKFNGLALGSGDGLEQLVRNYDPASITDVRVIFSTDIENFRRRTRRSAWDVYLIGSLSEEDEVTFIGNGVQRTFSLPNVPALGVTSVHVGNTGVGFTFLPDSSFQFRSSTRADDRVELDLVPGVNETVTIRYSYDKLITDTQAYVDKIGVNLYRSDILIRKAIPVAVRTRLLVQVLSSFDATAAASSAFQVASEYVSSGLFASLVFPNALRSDVASTVPGVSRVDVLEFTRDLTGSISVDVIELSPFEYLETPDSLIEIEIRR